MDDDLWRRSVDIGQASRAEQYTRRIRRIVLARREVTARPTRDALLRLSSAVCRVIELHRPEPGRAHPTCRACAVEFPCPTRRAISAGIFPDGTAQSVEPATTEFTPDAGRPWWCPA